MHVLVALLNEQVPFVVELIKPGEPETAIGHGVDVGSYEIDVADDRTGPTHVRRIAAGVHQAWLNIKGNRPRYVVDVTTLVLGVDHRTHGQRVSNQGYVDDSVRQGVWIAPACRDSVTRAELAAGSGQLRLVGDVANRTRL